MPFNPFIHLNWFLVAKVCWVPDDSVVGINEGMCVVYFKLCLMFDYVVEWYTFMSCNSNNITWCHKLFIICIIFITKLYNIIICIYIIQNL